MLIDKKKSYDYIAAINMEYIVLLKSLKIKIKSMLINNDRKQLQGYRDRVNQHSSSDSFLFPESVTPLLIILSCLFF